MCKMIQLITSIILITIFVVSIPFQEVQAGTIYLSDGLEHEEGYIIIGESHIVLSANAFSNAVDENRKVNGLNDVYYHYIWDDSVWKFEGNSNTFTMWGNLFFVFEGNHEDDAALQKSKEYIYSDGQGNRGVGVEKIHEIMKTNPMIKHWNIISYHGAISALTWQETAGYYVDSYRNWMEYEFPEADIFFVSHSTMTKFYRQNKTAYQFDEAIKKAFPNQYFDYTEFYKKRQAEFVTDTIHWTHEIYVELFVDVIKRIENNDKFIECKGSKIIYEKRQEKNGCIMLRAWNGSMYDGMFV